MARQQRLPFHDSTIHSTKPFQLVHIDIWGPYNTKTYNGFKYFLTLVDDYSRVTWTHLLSSKSNALSILKAFTSMVKVHFNSSVHTFRSDHAFELGSSVEAATLFASQGILHQTTISHTPQQNGVVDRKYKHLLEVSRALLFQSKLPLTFWSDCVLTVIYLINRMPSPLLLKVSPYEKLHGCTQSYDYLRSFGCMCFATSPKAGRNKFQSRAISYIFLGYPCGKKGYKLLNMPNSSVFYSRDVIFHEHIFPYSSSSPPSLSSVLPSPFVDIPSSLPVILSHLVSSSPIPLSVVIPLSTSAPLTSPAIPPTSTPTPASPPLKNPPELLHNLFISKIMYVLLPTPTLLLLLLLRFCLVKHTCMSLNSTSRLPLILPGRKLC